MSKKQEETMMRSTRPRNQDKQGKKEAVVHWMCLNPDAKKTMLELLFFDILVLTIVIDKLTNERWFGAHVTLYHLLVIFICWAINV